MEEETILLLETSEIQHSDSSGVHMGYTLYENCGGKGTGMVGPQTVVSMYLAWTEMGFRH